MSRWVDTRNGPHEMDEIGYFNLNERGSGVNVRARRTKKRGKNLDEKFYYKISGPCFYLLLLTALIAFLLVLAAIPISIVAFVNTQDDPSDCNDNANVYGTGVYSVLPPVPYEALVGSWVYWGRTLTGSRNVNGGPITASSVGSMTEKWSYTALGSITFQPSLFNGVLYFCDDNGHMTAVKEANGAQMWQVTVSAITGGTTGDYCRGISVVPDLNALVAGSRTSGVLFAVYMDSGSKMWSTTIETHPHAQMTQPLTVYDGIAYTGVSSNEEQAALNPDYVCCSFRGSFLAIDIKTGELQWKTYMVPQNYTGAAVWGPAPTIDLARKQVYIGTGNLYVDPPGLIDCENAISATGAYFMGEPCLPKDVYTETVLAIDMSTGEPNWATRVGKADAWNVACGVNTPTYNIPPMPYNCPNNSGPDSDFAQAPMIMRIKYKDVLAAGQKSGIFWFFNPDNGEIMNSVPLAPWGDTGGIQWSGSNNGKVAFMALTNSRTVNFTLYNEIHGDTITSGSAFAAVDVPTGRVMWSYADESWLYSYMPVSSTNDVVFAPSTTRVNPATAIASIKALFTDNGSKLWEAPSNYLATSGVTIGNGMIFVGVNQLDSLDTTKPYRLVAFGL